MSDLGGMFILEDTLSPALAVVGAEYEAEVQERCLALAQDILDYAKSNAPWQDRTGDARAGLDVDVSEDVDAVIIQLYHTVDYGLWLEVIQNGEYAILLPTLEHFAGTITQDIEAGGDSS